MPSTIKEQSEYEKLREKNIAMNEAMLQSLFPVSPLLKKREEGCRPIRRSLEKRQQFAQNHPYSQLPARKNPSRLCRGRKRVKYGSESEEEEDMSSDFVPEEADSSEEEFLPSGMIVKLWGKKSDFDQVNPPKRRSPTKNACNKDELVERYNLLTEEDLDMVAERTSDKNYDQTGTTCHQCRQKTDDLKTLCRSESCVGVRGQFCGPCLRNRYGENAKVAIMDSAWVCPPCRGICNCSFCMAKKGRRATGILIHIAKEKGYESVKSFLGD